MPSPNDICQTYWIRDETCTDPFTDGYIGITMKKLEARRRAHIRDGRVSANSTIVILHQGFRYECAAVEKYYRPDKNTGLNRDNGGGRWRGDKPVPRRAEHEAFYTNYASQQPSITFPRVVESDEPVDPE